MHIPRHLSYAPQLLQPQFLLQFVVIVSVLICELIHELDVGCAVIRSGVCVSGACLYVEGGAKGGERRDSEGGREVAGECDGQIGVVREMVWVHDLGFSDCSRVLVLAIERSAGRR